MSKFKHAMPEISVRLFKTISRASVDSKTAVSKRYAGKDEYIDLTPYLGEGATVRTTKSIREPAGAFSISFMDKANVSGGKIESVYGLVEPMDGIEIRMWGGTGKRPSKLPIVMRGFISSVQRAQAMSGSGKPIRSVMVSGQDYGKIWQMYQVLYFQSYSEGKALLTTYALWELFDLKAVNTLKSGQLVSDAITKILNPFLDNMLPSSWPKNLSKGADVMPKNIIPDITVKRGVVNNSYQNTQGSIYTILSENTDVPTWNEMYIEDREDGVFCVYRPIPALKLTAGVGEFIAKIQSDAPDPIYCEIDDGDIQSTNVVRSDANVANFYWVNNTRYDLIDELQRKLQSIPLNDSKVDLSAYPNSSAKFYGTRPMYASTQMTDDSVTSMLSGQTEGDISRNQSVTIPWIDQRRRELVEMNQDNVVLENGSARVKGGQMRPNGKDLMRAGDYARFITGNMVWDAYCVNIEHEFIVYSGYTCNINFERGEGFATRIAKQSSPYLTEQASKV